MALFTILWTIIGISTTGAFVWLEFGGIFHAFSRHGMSDGLLAVFVPPVAWYRSIEYFWHDHHSDAEWKEILSDDVVAMFALVGVDDPEFAVERPRLVAMMRERVSRYPNARRQELRDLVNRTWEYAHASVIASFSNMDPAASLGAALAAEASARERVVTHLGSDAFGYIEAQIETLRALSDFAAMKLESVDRDKESYDQMWTLLELKMKHLRVELDSLMMKICE